VKQILNPTHIKIVYKALVESLISYGIIGRGGVNKSNISQLQIAQNDILRIVLNKNYHYNNINLYNDFKVLTVKKLFYKSAVIFILKNNLLNKPCRNLPDLNFIILLY